MNIFDTLAYAALLISISVAPGPLVAILIARTVAGDRRGALGFGLGIALGDVLMIGLVGAGLGYWLQQFPSVFETVNILAVVYVLWIAFSIWRGAEYNSSAETSSGTLSSVFAGFITCLISPQTLLLYLLLLPRLVGVSTATAGQFSIIAAMTFIIIGSTFTLIVGFASRITAMLHSGGSNAMILKTMAVATGLSGIWLAVA